jgi:hypothetical protein
MRNAGWNLRTNRSHNCVLIFISRLTTEGATVTYIMALPPSDAASLVQQAALRINLKHETEQEILKKLEAEYINDLRQLQRITMERWLSIGAPIGFVASVESCLNEAGFSSLDKRQLPARGRSKTEKGRNLSSSSNTSSKDQCLASQKSSKNASKNAGERHEPLRRRMKKDSSSAASASSSSTTLKAAFTELKDTLRRKSKEGRALAVNDSKGNPIYEWEQSSDHVLVYVAWPFPFDYDDPDTKCKFTIASETVLIKGKRQNDSRSLRYTTGGLVNMLHSKWSVVYKGSRSNKKKLFAIEIALCKKNAGDIWNTALKAKHIGTHHMTAGEINEQLQSYGIEASASKTKEERLKALRLARSKKNTAFSAMSPNLRSQSADLSLSPRSVSMNKQKVARAPSYDMPESFVDDDSSAPRSQAKRGVQTNCRFIQNQVVSYTSNDSTREKARILKIHLDDELVPFYDIRMEDSGKEKQTDDSHISSLTDGLFKSILNPKGSGRSDSVDTEISELTTDRPTHPHASPGSLSIRGKKTDRSRSYDMSESLVDDFSDATTSKSQAKRGAQTNSRFMESQVVSYASNDGFKEKARILKIHLDDELVPFYDIRMEDSGKEKQTDDAHLSSLTDDLFKSVFSSSSSPTMSSNNSRFKEQRPASPHFGRVKTELKSYGISPDTYVDKEELNAAWKNCSIRYKKECQQTEARA